jgi:hypothetical protein
MTDKIMNENQEQKQAPTICCVCEVNVQREADILVERGTAPTQADHDQRQSALEAAFAEE